MFVLVRSLTRPEFLSGLSVQSQQVNMRPDKHFRLRVLGRLSLDVVVGEVASPASLRRRHLAVLALLATSERATRRDALVALLWGDEPEGKARHSLSNS